MEEALKSLRGRWPKSDWLALAGETAALKWNSLRHGDLPRWRAAIEALPMTPQLANLSVSAPELGAPIEKTDTLHKHLMALHPWRKGPLRLGGLTIDTEWRSDWKWDRIAKAVDLDGQRVLDIGCGNGYFGLRMLGAGAQLVVGIDPTVLFVMQWLACRHFSGDLPNYVLPLGVEELPSAPAGFDSVFSMGVLYHRRDPAHHLQRIHSLLKKAGGTMVLETLVLPQGREDDVLIPQGRYAQMRNVWAIPGTGSLMEWVRTAGFTQAEIVNITPTRTAEQKSTEWMPFESLAQALDQDDDTKTIEGHPAPVRALIIARR